jgi:hypothetical protein
VSLNAPVLITPWLLCLNPLYGSPDSTQRKFVIEVTTEIRDEFDSESRKVRFDKKEPGINANIQIKARDSKFDADLNGTAGPPSR